MITQNMGLFSKKGKIQTKCDVCDLELPSPEGIKKKHMAMFQKKKWTILVAM